MGRSFVDSERCESVKKRVYLPDVDEFRSSSGPLCEVVMETLDGVSCCRAKRVKEGYITDLTREGGLSPCSVMLGLLYLRRLSETSPRFLRTISGKDLFLTAMMIASKYLNDEGEREALTNSEWAEVGCRSKPALDLMERQFLAAIDWRLYVSLDEYYSFVTGIEGRIALNQFADRGWLTYTDLVTLWDAMDTQRALLTATKHVAKVTCGSAAVYLVLLSTLFTASHTLHSTWSPSSPLTSSPSTTNTCCTPSNPSLEAAIPLLMTKEHADITTNPAPYNQSSAHWKYHHHYRPDRDPKPLTVDYSTVACTGVRNTQSPSMQHLFAKDHRRETLSKLLDGHSSFSCSGVYCREKQSQLFNARDLMDHSDLMCGNSGSADVCGEQLLWLGAIDMFWTARVWSAFSRETLSFDNLGKNSHESDTHDGHTTKPLSLLDIIFKWTNLSRRWIIEALADYSVVLGPAYTVNASSTNYYTHSDAQWFTIPHREGRNIMELLHWS